MSSATMPTLSLTGMLVVAVFWAAQLSVALNIEFCSNFNTGAENQAVTNLYQSNGACFDQCKQGYALAVVQGDTCWCSDYVPAETASTDECDQTCPGYGFETCGSTRKGLFAYIALNKAPAGTQGPAPSSTETDEPDPATTDSSTSETPTTSDPPSTSASTSEEPPPPTSSESATPTSFSTSFTSTTSDTSTWSPTPVTSLLTITGEVRTVTITPTEPPRATASLERDDAPNFWSQTGKVVGLFVGLALLIILSMLAFFLWHRRRQRPQSGSGAANARASYPTPPPSRSLSEFGLLHENRTTLVEKDMTDHWDQPMATTTADKRSSRARIVDQRLDPRAIWSSEFDNMSRSSIPSLQDDRDYSRRVLRLANPDSSAA